MINKPTKTSKKKEVKKKSKPINKIKKDNRNIPEIIDKRYGFLIVLVAILYVIILGRVFYLQVLKNDYYNEKLAMSTEKTIESSSAPRGRIYDRNYNLLVDNEAIKTIYYILNRLFLQLISGRSPRPVRRTRKRTPTGARIAPEDTID